MVAHRILQEVALLESTNAYLVLRPVNPKSTNVARLVGVPQVCYVDPGSDRVR